MVWNKYSVRTFDKRGLDDKAAELYHLVRREFEPNLLIGIRTGGYCVAEPMKALTPDCNLLPITCRRPTSAKKYKFPIIKQILGKLPASIADLLRVVEVCLMVEWRKPKKVAFTADAKELQDVAVALKHLGADARILVIDDCVDSGATISAVVETLRGVADPMAIIKVAAITITKTMPLMQPDYVLHRYMLCRFPWALDFKASADA